VTGARTARRRRADMPASDPVPVDVPRWLPVTTLVLCVVGLAISVYLTLAHYDKSAVSLVCPQGGAVNCEKVTTSAESVIFGVPVPVFGLVFFVAMLVANLPRMWASPRREVLLGRLAFAIAGIGMVVYLVYTELFVLSAICIWCSAVHLITLVLFAVIAIGTASLSAARRA
jgi:uncharacterized membrane protein